MTNDDSDGEINYTIVHAMANLYRRIGNQRYLDMAEWIVKMWEKPGGPEYMKYALEGRPAVEMPAHRWIRSQLVWTMYNESATRYGGNAGN